MNLEVRPDSHDKGNKTFEDLVKGQRGPRQSNERLAKIQDHAARPPTPLISEIPRASNPPNAPAAVAAEKKMALFHYEIP